MRQMRDASFRFLLLGDVLNDEQQVLRIAVVIEHRYAARKMRAGSAMRRMERVLAESLRLKGIEHLLVPGGDDVGRAVGEQFADSLADHLVARNAINLFACAIDQDVTKLPRILDADGRRDVVDDEFEELARLADFLLALAQFGDVFVGSDPAAACDRLVDHVNGAAIGQIDGDIAEVALAILRHQLGNVRIRIAVERTSSFAVRNQLAQADADLRRLRRQAVHFHVPLVAQQKARVIVEHAQTLCHVVERDVEFHFLFANGLAVGKRRDGRECNQRDDECDDCVVTIFGEGVGNAYRGHRHDERERCQIAVVFTQQLHRNF